MGLWELRPRCEGIEGIRGGDAAPTGAGVCDGGWWVL